MFASMRRALLTFVPLACVAAFVVHGSFAASKRVTAASGHVTSARFCGPARCVQIPAAIAKLISGRGDAFQPASTPKPAPFYRITIKATGEGYVPMAILWVPTRKLWYMKEYPTPPLAGYWRTGDVKADPVFAQLARAIRPFPAPRHWVLPK